VHNDGVLSIVISRQPIPLHRRKIGLAVRARRDDLGLSQERLAESADCHRNYVGLVERGDQNLTLDGLVKFAKALKCKPSEILKDAGL
jgi:transcriptional regulator with XRE-family HTH domain